MESLESSLGLLVMIVVSLPLPFLFFAQMRIISSRRWHPVIRCTAKGLVLAIHVPVALYMLQLILVYLVAMVTSGGDVKHGAILLVFSLLLAGAILTAMSVSAVYKIFEP